MHCKRRGSGKSTFLTIFCVFFFFSLERLFSKNSTRKPVHLIKHHRFLQTNLVNPLVTTMPLVCTLLSVHHRFSFFRSLGTTPISGKTLSEWKGHSRSSRRVPGYSRSTSRNWKFHSRNTKFHSRNGLSRLDQYETRNSRSNSRSDSRNCREPTLGVSEMASAKMASAIGVRIDDVGSILKFRIGSLLERILLVFASPCGSRGRYWISVSGPYRR